MKIAILVLNQSSISAVFPIVQFAGDPKTALTGDPLYVTLADFKNWYSNILNPELQTIFCIVFDGIDSQENCIKMLMEMDRA